VGATVDVKVADNVFRPKKLTILPGTTVRWTNTGRNEHDVLPNKGKRFGIDELEPDAQYSFTFEKPGRYAYYCSFHGAPGVGQHATVRVVEDRPRGA
jgi:plastocyanin